MASAHAKFTGEVGVCLATSGPGAIHLLNGLYDARLDHMPVLAIVGQQARAALGGHYQQELDLGSLFKDVAGAFVQQASVPAQVRHLVDRAMRIAKAERRVTLHHPAQRPAGGARRSRRRRRKHGTVHSGIGYGRAEPGARPRPNLRQAAEVLNAGSKVAMLVGAGALQATDEVIAVAEQLGAGVAKALLGKAAVPDDLPWVTGSIGLLGTRPSWDMMTECDTLLMIGSGFPYSEFLPKEGQARGVQIDIDPGMLSLRYPMEVNLLGDSRADAGGAAAAAAAEARTAPGAKRSRRTSPIGGRRWRGGRCMSPIRSIRSASSGSCRRACRKRASSAGDSGSRANWYARDVKIRRGMMASLSGGLATMGAGVPYAIAAKFAHPDRPVHGDWSATARCR